MLEGVDGVLEEIVVLSKLGSCSLVAGPEPVFVMASLEEMDYNTHAPNSPDTL